VVAGLKKIDACPADPIDQPMLLIQELAMKDRVTPTGALQAPSPGAAVRER